MQVLRPRGAGPPAEEVGAIHAPQFDAQVGGDAEPAFGATTDADGRDHRLEWMIRSGGIDVVLTGLREDTIRFSWPG